MTSDLFVPDSQELPKFPKTRYQGSKRKLITTLYTAFQSQRFQTCLDLYSGTATVSLLLRFMDKTVTANDYLLFNQNAAYLFLNANSTLLNAFPVTHQLQWLLYEAPLPNEPLVCQNFASLFFTNSENLEIDRFASNVQSIEHPLNRALLIYAIGQALMKKRPYNLFHRANLDMRLRDVQRNFGNATTWKKPIASHAQQAVNELLRFPFPNDDTHRHAAYAVNTLHLDALPQEFDLIYLDPPYLNGKGSPVNYCTFYHFLEGLVDYQKFAEFNPNLAHRPIAGYRSAWNSHDAAIDELERVALRWPTSTLVLSYRNDGYPTLKDLEALFSRAGRQLTASQSTAYKYALAHSRTTEEALLIIPPQTT